ncbi:Ureohydrolase [Epithele typhae]|uniref:Ureohydrolase n=1 Tax=Epithele typhae TaxID=378194 RepID=UPI0020072B01|nr:Ureohydrolase [Epithele typhae]KAH9945829.1 Ureohydrolase [Epithele typhae]
MASHLESSVSRFLPDPKTVAIVGCPFKGGQTKAGVDNGPIHLVAAGLPEQLTELGWKVLFDGHHQFDQISAEDDPQLAMGTISGTFQKYPDACVIWVDAHADINTARPRTPVRPPALLLRSWSGHSPLLASTPHGPPTGNIHGMPVSFLMGLGPKVDEFAWVQPVLKPHRIVYIGLRDVDQGERRILKEHGIKAYSMHEVDKYGIGRVVDMALDHVNPGRTRPVHLSFDVDALDPTVAPSTGTPVRGGLTFREGHYICEAVYETGCLVALDIMEVNPSLEDQSSVEQTVAVGCSLARAALGETLL